MHGSPTLLLLLIAVFFSQPAYTHPPRLKTEWVQKACLPLQRIAVVGHSYQERSVLKKCLIKQPLDLFLFDPQEKSLKNFQESLQKSQKKSKKGVDPIINKLLHTQESPPPYAVLQDYARYFDAIWLPGTIQYWDRLETLTILNNIRTALKKGGTLYVSTQAEENSLMTLTHLFTIHHFTVLFAQIVSAKERDYVEIILQK
jgi:hypothetical protein